MGLFNNKELKALQAKVHELEKRDIWTTIPLSSLGIPYKSSFEINKNMTLSAVYCAVNRISDAIATLDLKPYRIDEKGFRHEFKDHPLWELLTVQPNSRMGKYNFWKVGICNMLNNGNFYIHIKRNESFTPTELELIAPNLVAKGIVNGQKKYSVKGIKGLVDDSNMIHVLNFPDADDPETGISVMEYARQSLEGSYNAEIHSSEFLKNGTNANVYIQAEGRPTPQQVSDIQNVWRNSYDATSGQKNIPVVPIGMNVHQLSISPRDAQLLESRQWNITEIARWYNINSALLHDNTKQLSGTVEAMQIEFLNTTLQPLMQKIINEFVRKLILPKDRQTITLDFDTTDLIKMDSTATAAYYTQMTNNGFYSVNDVRKKLGQPYAEGGDEVYITVQQQNLKYPVVMDKAKDNNLKEKA
jgi:HK97 family phage portal protein